MEQKSIDGHPVGVNFSGAKLTYNNWQTNARASYKTGKYEYLVLLGFPIFSKSHVCLWIYLNKLIICVGYNRHTEEAGDGQSGE
jgi:hypothetical protein